MPRWNPLGALGGKALLEALRWNSKLLTIRLEGTGVPADIRKEIGQ